MKKYLLIGTVLVLLILGCAIFCLFSPYFDIREIYVNDVEKRDSVIKDSGIGVGENIFLVNLRKAKKSILQDREIETVDLKRCLPSKIQIHIGLKHPSLILVSDGLWGVTHEGEIIEIKGAIPNLPILTGITIKPQPHTFIPDTIKKILFALLDTMETYYPHLFEQISEFNWDKKSGMGFFLKDKDISVKIGNENFDRRLARLERVLAELQNETKKPNYIDLRYKSQVIVRFREGKGESLWKI